ncbi:HMG box protein [Aspergillus sp. HF37]|nr:HMG box protein [Aspergillus sp. HF37]
MSPKEDSKKDEATVSVNLDEFAKTRDSVLYSLTQLQAAVSDLSRAYIHHTNTVLNRDTTGIDLSNLTSGIASTLQEHGLLGLGALRPDTAGGDKPKRKRAPPDPNAPKRALTPFFLFMQHNRPKIAEELGAAAKPKEVADEGTKRWGTLPESQKEIWRKLYADNLANYREKMKAYKAGRPIPDDDNVKAANQLQQDTAGAKGSDESDQESSESEAESEEEASPSPVKEPTPPRSGKRRRSEAKAVKEPAPAPTPSKKDEGEKKKRSSGRKGGEEKKKEEEESAAARKSADSKRSKKKRKSEVGSED